MPGIYIHIPFCKQACHYCNFHFSTSRAYQDRMVEAILLELEQRKAYLETQTLNSIYFGGGTPSLLEYEQLNRIFEKIGHYWKLDPGAEITIETNPDDLNAEYLDGLRNTAVNRLSIGIQSFHDKDLEWMNRAHNSDQAIRSLEMAGEKGFENITADLIYGIPGQTLEDWKENIETLLSTGIGHISAYALTVEPKTALGHWVKKGNVAIPPDELVIEQFDLLIDMTGKAGFDHYEISNFAKPGQYAIHNSSYWKGEPYLGIGPSAHSFNGYEREWNTAHNIRYMEALEEGSRTYEKEELKEGDRYNEMVMTRLRTLWGITEKELLTIGPWWVEFFNQQVIDLQKKGWLECIAGTWRLTRKGKHWADLAAAELFYTAD